MSVIPEASQTHTLLSSDIFSLTSQIQMESKCDGSGSVIGINSASGELKVAYVNTSLTGNFPPWGKKKKL